MAGQRHFLAGVLPQNRVLTQQDVARLLERHYVIIERSTDRARPFWALWSSDALPRLGAYG